MMTQLGAPHPINETPINTRTKVYGVCSIYECNRFGCNYLVYLKL